MKKAIVNKFLVLCVLSALIISLFAVTTIAESLPQDASLLEAKYNNAPACISTVHCWYADKKVTANVIFSNVEQAGKLYLAIYNEGKMIALQGKAVAEGELLHTIEIADADESYKNYTAKVFYWDSNSMLKPLAKDVETKITLQAAPKTYQLKGYVVANSLTALAGNVPYNNEVHFRVTKVAAGDEKYWKVGTSYTLSVGKTDIASTLGFLTDIVVSENEEGEYEVISYSVSKDNKSVKINDTENIMSTESTIYPSVIRGAYGDYISVFDEDTDVINTTYYLEGVAALLVNGQKVGTVAANASTPMYNLNGDAGTDLGLIWAPKSGTVTLLDNDNDGAYDYVFVETYVAAVVDDILNTASANKIYTKTNEVIDLYNHINGASDYTYSLTLNGKEATLSDLQEYDVINVAMTKNKRHYDIIATRNIVSGLVTETYKPGVNLAEYEFTVGGKAYKAANLNEINTSGLGGIRVGDEAIFYLDAFGKVALAERFSSAAKNYGFIVAAGREVSTGEETYQVRLLDKEGNIKIYALADSVRFASAGDAGNVMLAPPSVVYNKISALDYNSWKPYTISNQANIDAYAKRIITYRTDSEGKISEIVFASARVNGKEPYLTYNSGSDVKAGVMYNAKTQTFVGARSVDENTVVFNLPMHSNVTKADFSVDTIASLSHEGYYDVAFLAVDEENVAGLVIVVNSLVTVPKDSNLAVVKKVMAAQNADYEDIYKITFVQNGEEKTLPTTTEVCMDSYGIAVGSIFEYTTDKNGAINAVGVDGMSDFLDIERISDYSSAYNSHGAKVQYVFGPVYSKNKNRVIAIGAAQDTHLIPENANFILVDLTKTKNNILVSSYDEFKAHPYDYSVFMKYYEEEITDVIIYKGYRELTEPDYEPVPDSPAVSGPTQAVEAELVIEDSSKISSTFSEVYPSVINGTNSDYISIYDDETDVTNTSYYLDAKTQLYVNGQLQGTLSAHVTTPMYNLDGDSLGSDLGLMWAPNFGTVTLKDTDKDGDYDQLYVETYVAAVVDEAVDSTNSKKIYTKSAEAIDLYNHINGVSGYTYSLTLNGKEATLSDLQEYDVINVAMSRDKKHYDIIATRNPVSGVVSEADKTGYLSDSEFVVNGVTYKAANLDIVTNSNLARIRVGDEVIFYLDAFGKVALAERNSSASKNYGFIVSAGKDVTVGDTTYQVRLLDKEGNIVTYALADKVRYASASANGVVASNTPAATVYAAINALAANWNPLTANTAANIDAYARRIITFKTNQSGEISELVFAGARMNGKELYLTYTGAADVKSNVTYNAKTQTFVGARSVDENTVVFNLPMNKNVVKEDFTVDTIASLSHEEKYDVAFLAVDEENIAGLVIVVNNSGSVVTGTNLAVVTRVTSAVNEEYEEIYNITFVQNGEEKTLATTAEVAQLGVPTVGSVFEYATDKNGAISAVGVEGISDFMDIASATNYPSAYVFNGAKVQYVYGTVYAKTDSRVIAIGAAYDTHAIPAEANFSLVDLTKTKNNVSVSSFNEIKVWKTDNGVVIPDNDYTVFMKYYNDEITDVIIYKGANALGFGN